MTKILKCKCEHKFQDHKYGKGMRVHNATAKGTKENPSYRCTVCESTK